MDAGVMNAWQLMLKGGPLMWLILFCSLIGMALFLEKLSYFFSISADVIDLKTKVFNFIKQNKLKDAIVLCEHNNSPVAKIMKAGIVKYGASREDIKEAMEGASLYEIPKLEKRLSVLSTIAHLAPLLGLLGTVVGMTVSFQAIQTRSLAMNPASSGDLAGGIWQALLTTVFGLIVAIPTLLAYNYCIARVNGFVIEMERAATDVINLLSQLSVASVSQEQEEPREI